MEVTPVNEVLNCQEVLEVILEHAVNQSDSKAEALSLRLIHPRWAVGVVSVYKYIRKEPLFHLTFNEPHIGNRASSNLKNNKLLNKFVNLVTSSTSRLHPVVPTFSLSLGANFFLEENIKSVYRCFRKCRKEVGKLEIILPPVGDIKLFESFPIPSLPLLKKIIVDFGGTATYSKRRLAYDIVRSNPCIRRLFIFTNEEDGSKVRLFVNAKSTGEIYRTWIWTPAKDIF